MRIGIVCKVIDNFGDAGFSLRLARALAALDHQVFLFHDNAKTFQALYPAPTIECLALVEASKPAFSPVEYSPFDLLLEPFGTSSEQTEYRFDRDLKTAFPLTPWLLIDYLSCERWVEDFHLSQSIDPATGHATTYFYPGFTARTGGLIHCDYPTDLQVNSTFGHDSMLKIFIFAYPNAPLRELIEVSEQLAAKGRKTGIYTAGSTQEDLNSTLVRRLPFCAQSEFDHVLALHDVLFVRGEDSFVRAQLAGKPMIWQIYPTEDEAHAGKLASFFAVYSEGLSTACKSALWECWLAWNRLPSGQAFASAWISLLTHLPELNQHATTWKVKLFNARDLVKEILTWHLQQTPTFKEKPDL